MMRRLGCIFALASIVFVFAGLGYMILRTMF